MRDQPTFVGGVPCEAAPDMIVDPAGHHRIKCACYHLQGSGRSCSPVTTQEQRKSCGGRKLRRAAESAVALIKIFAELCHRVVKYGDTDRNGRDCLEFVLQPF